MFKSILPKVVCMSIFLITSTCGWGQDNIDDRFINPDITTSKTIFIDVKDVSLMDVLKIISKQSGLSFIAAEDVADKKITLYLNKIPLNQALMTILDANGLTYEMQQDTNVFVVKAKYKTEKTKITRVYQLKYATVSASKLNTTLATGGSASASEGLEQVLKDSLTEDGKIVEDPRTNSLIITDVPGQFDIIESTIAKLDVPVPQVLIEVEMLDVSKSVADQLGITYGANPISFRGGVRPINFPFGPLVSGNHSLTPSVLPTGGNPLNNSVYPGVDASGMTAELNFLSTHTDAKTLARPRILTLNNQTAQIEISTDQAISVEQTSSSSGTSGSTTGNTVERYTTGVILKVTPQANMLTREITMAVSPKVIDVILSQVQPPAGSSQQIYDPETRGSDSMLNLKDGESMVIGGLMTNQDNVTKTKLPVLGDLPFIGSAFRSSSTKKSERELLIFLTPHIIDDASKLTNFNSVTSPSTAQASLNVQEEADRAQEVDNSLDNFESK